MNTFLTLLVAESGDPGEPRLLTDVFLMVVFFAFILILTSPFWGPGTIYWSLHRRSKQIRKTASSRGLVFKINPRVGGPLIPPLLMGSSCRGSPGG